MSFGKQPIGDQAIGDSPDSDLEFWDQTDLTEDDLRLPVFAYRRKVGTCAAQRQCGASAPNRITGVL